MHVKLISCQHCQRLNDDHSPYLSWRILYRLFMKNNKSKSSFCVDSRELIWIWFLRIENLRATLNKSKFLIEYFEGWKTSSEYNLQLEFELNWWKIKTHICFRFHVIVVLLLLLLAPWRRFEVDRKMRRFLIIEFTRHFLFTHFSFDDCF